MLARLLKTAFAAGLMLAAGCGKPVFLSPDRLFPSECGIAGDRQKPADSVMVALFHPVEPGHAPIPRNTSERILFRHLYQTLVRIDCLGGVRPDLADSWEKSDGGRVWTFELSDEARFWDGSPLTADDVIASWGRVERAMSCHGINSIRSEGDRLLRVHLNAPHKELPFFFASGEFAVSKATAGSKWPLGSGPYQIVTSRRESDGMFRRTITVYPHYNRADPMIQFVEASAFDARDLLEGAVDMMVTSDPSVIDYARNQPKFETAALDWDRTYVFISTSRLRELLRGSDFDAVFPELSQELARDAVRSEARGFRPPAWWDEIDGCEGLEGTPPGEARVLPNPDANEGLQRVLYEADDPVSQNIAERIIALAMTDPNASPAAAALIAAVPDLGEDTEGLIAQGLTENELAERLRAGSDFAYIIALPRRPADPCCAARMLFDRMPLLAGQGINVLRAVVPLVDARSRVIVNRTGIALSVDWFGNVFITNGMEP